VNCSDEISFAVSGAPVTLHRMQAAGEIVYWAHRILVQSIAAALDRDTTDNVDSYKKDSSEVGSPEKVNLDQSLGDESMEEDVMESKQAESKIKSNDLRWKSEFNFKDVKEVVLSDSIVKASSVDIKEVIAEEKSAASAEKRKLKGLCTFLLLALFSQIILWNKWTIWLRPPTHFDWFHLPMNLLKFSQEIFK
jgi:hypothetical protein